MAYPSRATPLQVDVRDRRNRAPAPALPRAHDPNIAKRRYLRALFACVVLVGAFIVSNGNPAHAQNATWLSNPGTNSFNTGTNWSTGAVPTGTARFGASNTTTILFQPFTPTTIGTLQFDRGAPAYTFVTAPTLFTSIAITGTGIVNHSANAPTFVVGNQANLTFQNASTAGNANIITNNGGITLFTGTATGGDARLVANAGGVVDISGIANVNVGGSFFVPRAYTILSSSGLVIGRFDEVIDNRPSFEAEISYTPHKVIVTLFFDPLAAVSRPSAGGGAINQNQFSVLKAIVNSFNATGQIPVEFGNISTVHDLSELTGEVGTAVQQAAFNTMDRFLDTLLDPFLGERGGRAPIDSLAAYAPEDAKTAILRKAPPFAGGDVFPRWSQWATQYGGTQSTAGSPIVGSNDTRSNMFGVAAGADYRLLPDTLVGFGIGGAFTDFTVANGLGSGSDDSFQAGAYVRHSFGQAYVAAALAYGIHDLQTDRTVTIAGLDELHAQFKAHTISGRAEVGYRYATPWMGITPYAAGQSTTIFLPGRTEQSSLGAADPFVLSYAANDVTAPRSDLGFRGDTSFVFGDSIVTLRDRLAWAHNFNTGRVAAASFQLLPVSSFVVAGAAQDADATLVSAAAEMKWLNGFSVAVRFDGEFSGNVQTYTGSAIVRYQW